MFSRLSSLYRKPFLRRKLHDVIVGYDMPTRPGYFVHAAAGLRVIELNKPEEGNYLTLATVKSIHNRLETYQTNDAVSAVMFFATSDVFSLGLDPVEYKTNLPELLVSIHRLSRAIKASAKPILTCYNGLISGTAFAVFHGAKYRLATASARLCVDDLFRGQLPLGGFVGTLLRVELGQPGSVDLSFLRYLAVSGRTMDAQDLWEYQLVTHIVEDNPFLSLMTGFGRSQNKKNHLRAVQISPANLDDLDNLLNSMSIHWDQDHFKLDPDEEVDPEECDIDKDIFEEDKSFRDFHRPLMTKAEREAEIDRVMESVDWVETDSDVVDEAFAFDDVKDCLTVLEARLEHFPQLQPALAGMKKLDPALLQTWFNLVEQVYNNNKESHLQVEMRIACPEVKDFVDTEFEQLLAAEAAAKAASAGNIGDDESKVGDASVGTKGKPESDVDDDDDDDDDDVRYEDEEEDELRRAAK